MSTYCEYPLQGCVWKTFEAFIVQSIFCTTIPVTMAIGPVRDLGLVQMSCSDYGIFIVLPVEVFSLCAYVNYRWQDPLLFFFHFWMCILSKKFLYKSMRAYLHKVCDVSKKRDQNWDPYL